MLRPSTPGTVRCHQTIRAARWQWYRPSLVLSTHACHMTPQSPGHPTLQSASFPVWTTHRRSTMFQASLHYSPQYGLKVHLFFTGSMLMEMKKHECAHVTTALGFFSTAYTLSFRSACLAAFRDALTRGPRPAPNTINTLYKETGSAPIIPLFYRWGWNTDQIKTLHPVPISEIISWRG